MLMIPSMSVQISTYKMNDFLIQSEIIIPLWSIIPVEFQWEYGHITDNNKISGTLEFLIILPLEWLFLVILELICSTMIKNNNSTMIKNNNNSRMIRRMILIHLRTGWRFPGCQMHPFMPILTLLHLHLHLQYFHPTQNHRHQHNQPCVRLNFAVESVCN